MSLLALSAAPDPRKSTDHVGDAYWEPAEVLDQRNALVSRKSQ
jgi:hypothetical protein